MKNVNFQTEKNKFLILLVVICSVFFAGCNKRDKDKEREVSTQINDFMFELSRYSLTGKCDVENPEKYLIPGNLNDFTGRYVFENGQKYPLIEKYFPNKKGVIEGSKFYDASSDDASWVEDLLVAIEEQRIADEILSMEEDFSEAQYNPSEYEQQIEKALDKDSESVDIAGKDNYLRIMKFDKEIFMPYSKEDSHLMIDANGSVVERTFFDIDYKLIRKENWQINSITDAKMVSSEDYSFIEDSFLPSEKTIRTDTSVSHTYYNEHGLATCIKTYNIVERTVKKGKKSEIEKEEILVSQTDMLYNEDEKVTEQTNTVYYFNADYTKLDYSFEKKYVYMYNDFTDVLSEEDNNKIPADFEYFENGEIKMKNKYTAELGTYTSQIFFQKDFAVKTYYEVYKRVKDIYTDGQEVIRIKEYE